MKIRVDVEVSPEEVRTLIGLPDVKGLQDDAVQYVRDKMAQGVEGFEASALLRQFVPEAIQTANALQKMLMRGWGRFAGDEKDEDEVKPEPAKKKTTSRARAKPQTKPPGKPE